MSVQEPGAPSQAVTGVVAPALREARIREAWPSVVGLMPAVASLGKTLERSVILLPLGWLVLAPLFALKFAPFVCRRYTLTNRRLMIQRGLKPQPVEEVLLEQIDDIRLVEGSGDTFFFTATLEVISGGQVKMRLPGVPEPEGFRHAVLNAVRAWVPSKAQGPFQAASAIPKTPG